MKKMVKYRHIKRFLLLLSIPLLLHGGPDEDLGELDKQISALLKASRGKFAVAVHELNGTRELYINSSMKFNPASTMKTAVMVEAYRQASLGLIDFEQILPVKRVFSSVVDGSPYRLTRLRDDPGRWGGNIPYYASIRQLVEVMITRSSNIATNVLIEILTPDSITTTMKALGASSFQLQCGYDDVQAEKMGLRNTLTAGDLTIILTAIWEGRAVNTTASAEMFHTLLRQRVRNKIPDPLPPNVLVANKTGRVNHVEHDSAIVTLPNGTSYVLVILSKDLPRRKQG